MNFSFDVAFEAAVAGRGGCGLGARANDLGSTGTARSDLEALASLLGSGGCMGELRSTCPRALSTFGLLNRLNNDILDSRGSGSDLRDNGASASCFCSKSDGRMRRLCRLRRFCSSKVDGGRFGDSRRGVVDCRVVEDLRDVSSDSIKKEGPQSGPRLVILQIQAQQIPHLAVRVSCRGAFPVTKPSRVY